jgi:hypothetical protein
VIAPHPAWVRCLTAWKFECFCARSSATVLNYGTYMVKAPLHHTRLKALLGSLMYTPKKMPQFRRLASPQTNKVSAEPWHWRISSWGLSIKNDWDGQLRWVLTKQLLVGSIFVPVWLVWRPRQTTLVDNRFFFRTVPKPKSDHFISQLDRQNS